MESKQLTPLGRLIRQRRLSLGISLRDLESMTGLSRANLSRVETASNGLRPEALGGLSRALQLPLADLYEAAGFPIPQLLPSIRPYLRRAYNVPDAAAEEIEAYLNRLGLSAEAAPLDGEDELPE